MKDNLETLTFIKELAVLRMDLMNKKENILKNLSAGQQYFESRAVGKDTSKAIEQVRRLSRTLQLIDARIKDIDNTQIVALELILNNIGVQFSTPQSFDSAGELNEARSALLTSKSEGYKNIEAILNPKDLWAFQTLKEMFGATDVAVKGQNEE